MYKILKMHLFLTSSWSLDIPTAKITASALYDSLPQTTSVQLVSSLKKKSVTFLPSRISQPLDLRKSIKGSKIFSLTVPRHNTKSKSFYIIHRKVYSFSLRKCRKHQETLLNNDAKAWMFALCFPASLHKFEG